MSVLRKLLKYMKGYGKECVLGPLFKLLEAAFELLVPLVVAKIMDEGIASGNSGYIVNMCLVMVTLGVIGLVCAVTAQFFAAKAAVGRTPNSITSVMAILKYLFQFFIIQYLLESKVFLISGYHILP